MYGQCRSKTDAIKRVFEPRDRVKGMVARVTFYMADRYKLKLSTRDQRLYMSWDKQFPVSAWERERDRRIASVVGWHNPFVTGKRTWRLGYKPHGDGLRAADNANPPRAHGKILGNTKSRIYHLPKGCPSYHKVGKHHRRYFSSEANARKAGFRKARNCL